MTPSGQTICLCMIVKNEAPVISRCLASVRSLIDHWIIIDTGSTDGTQDVIRKAMDGVPGEVIERPWRDFAANRTEALALARPHGDYSLIMDADDVLDISDDFALPVLDADSYSIDIDFNGIRYVRPQLIKSALPWCYKGVLHEYLECEGARTSDHLPLTLRINSDGARRRDPQTYRNDAIILSRALAAETDSLLRARYTFYLAQSYRDCSDSEKAVTAYLDRAMMGHWDEEIFVSLYEAGKMMHVLGRNSEDVLATFARATAACPTRAEAAHAASRLCRTLELFERGYAIAKAAIGLPLPAKGLFVEPWVYHYGLLDECAVNAYWCGRHRDCLDLTLRALESGHVPAAEQPRFLQNIRFALHGLAVDQMPIERQ